ncbi:MAG TPA: serine hydrolase [Gemmatimonadaceae bacterium]|nr:serine hydrolase [Gemmatimonadaceae bacterium]
MRMFISSLALIGQILAPPAVRRPAGALVVTRSDSLALRITRRASQVSGAVIGVAYHDLQTNDSLYLNAGESFHAASTMKVPVMIELYHRIDAGALALDQGILLVNQFGSIVDGSPYSLDAGDDSDSSAYRLVGSRVPVRELIDRMITRSSNLATNALIELVGAVNANATAHTLGARDIRVLRGVEDDKAYRAGLNNTTTARDLAVLLDAIETARAASRSSCDRMRDIMLGQEFNTEIPAGLPAGTKVAHKTGWITGVLHDAAIVYPPGRRPYVLVVLTRGIDDRAQAQRLIADISRLVYAHAMASTIASRS